MTLNQFFSYFFNVHSIPMSEAGHLWWITLLQMIVRVLIGLFAILLVVPPLVWWERRLLGFMQQRQGPNRVGPGGILQTIADGVKLLFKEDMNPADVDKTLFVIAPIIFLIPALVTAGVIPWGPSNVWGAPAPGVNIGILYILAWASLAVYGIVLAGWSSNNKYSLLGGLRSAAQLISYELGMGLAILAVVLMTGSLGMKDIVEAQGYNNHWLFGATVPNWLALSEWNLGKFFPMGLLALLIYTISMLAETNRAPFDLPEAETELVAGYHTEYTSMKFATFFMGEYANMVITSAINATLFWGGYKAPIQLLDGSYLGGLLANAGQPGFGSVVAALVPVFWLTVKILCGLYFFIWIRATLPRLRYDLLMKFGWQALLPVGLINLLFVAVAITLYSTIGNLGWLIAAVAWVIVAAIGIVVFATTKGSRTNTAAVRRDSTIGLYSSAQPFRANHGKPGDGGQTLPPDARRGLPLSDEAVRLTEEREVALVGNESKN